MAAPSFNGRRVLLLESRRSREMASLVTTYGGRPVVNGISLEVKGGEVIGLLGPNGAGKTTTFHMMVGLVRPDGGRVSMNGDDLIVLQHPAALHAGGSRGNGRKLAARGDVRNEHGRPGNRVRVRGRTGHDQTAHRREARFTFRDL